MFRKVLVANRGEIAIRILRTLREMGLRSVAVYSEADRQSPHLGFADEAYPIGPAQAAQSYLSADRILGVAHRAGCDALVPGYGFLFLTHADTDILALKQVAANLPADFPPIRAHNIARLGGEADLLTFLARAAPVAQVVIVRLHGGRPSFAAGLERLGRLADEHDLFLLCVSGTDELDPELTALSNAAAPTIQELFAYLQLGYLIPQHRKLGIVGCDGLRQLANFLRTEGVVRQYNLFQI